jgi:Na+-exporting ATPase
VLTITMVVGMTVMRKANVVIRDLSALEALGGVTNICSDKTGTLTQGAMIVKKVWLPGTGVYTVNNSMDPNNPTEGEVTLRPGATRKSSTQSSDPEKTDYDQQRSTAGLKFDIPPAKAEKDQAGWKSPDEVATLTPALEELLRSTALCNLATVSHEQLEGENNKKWRTTGEPTEIALQVFAHRFDHGKRQLESKGWTQIAEFPFDSSIKRMSVIYKNENDGTTMVYTKGAVERVLDLCATICSKNQSEPMTGDLKTQVLKQMNDFAEQGQRVLAVASRVWTSDVPERNRYNDEDMRGHVEEGLQLNGLVGIYDPPREETKGAIQECSQAGIKVHMLTVIYLVLWK